MDVDALIKALESPKITVGGKEYEGCWGLNPALGLVMAYYSDKTVAAIPAQAFAPVVAI